MEFKDYKYERVDFEKAAAEASLLIKQAAQATDMTAFDEAFLGFNRLYAHIYTQYTLCEIRHSGNTLDEFYKQEQEYYDTNMPAFLPYMNAAFEAVLSSPKKEQIASKYGTHLFTIAQFQLKSFSPEIIPQIQEENRLSNEYQDIMASSLIDFEGRHLNLAELMKYIQSETDRDLRKRACIRFDAFLKEKEPVLDDLFDRLVKVRTEMGRKMGYADYIPLGYLRMNRYDYTRQDVERFRKQVEEVLVPVCSRLREKQAERLGIDKLRFYDNWTYFPDGNAVPHGDEDKLVEEALRMYSELSEETKEYFEFMVEHKLLDLTTRKGKAMGGYCTYIPEYRSPFIFSNFNGTSGDVNVLTHEAGHGFNAFCCRDFDVPLLIQATLETAEIHSTAMEFFTHKYMDRFFGSESEKYCTEHLEDTLEMIPYEIVVDAFQHEIYARPEMTPDERKTVWRALEKKYLPHIDYDGCEELEKGTYWYRQLHIFMDPFYYIDYALASCGALEYYGWMLRNRDEAWASYCRLCRLGGKLPYQSALKEVGLHSPFEEGSLEYIIGPLMPQLGL